MLDATLAFPKRFHSSEHTIQAQAIVLVYKSLFRYAQFIREFEVSLGAKSTEP